jgi:hypothetical protein
MSAIISNRELCRASIGFRHIAIEPPFTAQHLLASTIATISILAGGCIRSIELAGLSRTKRN